MVALSVSISASTSPAWTASPSLMSHLASLPSVIVGDRAGIRTSIGMDGFRSLAVPGSRGREDVGVELRRIGFGAVLGKLGGIGDAVADLPVDRKSTRLNSSH